MIHGYARVSAPGQKPDQPVAGLSAVPRSIVYGYLNRDTTAPAPTSAGHR